MRTTVTNNHPKRETLEAVAVRAAILVREIQKRDGEGNTIPAHLYGPLVALLRQAGAEVA